MGTVYVVWTYHVNRVNASQVATTTYVRWPLVINMDGHHHIRRMFILKDRITDAGDPRPLALLPHAPGNPVVLRLPKPIFVCESRDPDTAGGPARPPLETRTWAQAMALVTAPAVRAGAGGDLVNPFRRDLCNDGAAVMTAGGTIPVDEDSLLSSSSSSSSGSSSDALTPASSRRGAVLGLIPEGAGSSNEDWVQVDALFDAESTVREPPERSPFEPDTPEETRVRRERRELGAAGGGVLVPPLALREDEIVV